MLDEPFSNLDSAIKQSMREEIYKIIKETNTTTILVTHDINDSLNIADKILIFKAGIVQQYDKPEKMYCEPANCYCAMILGDMNKLFIGSETYYVRPEKVEVVKKSNHKNINYLNYEQKLIYEKQEKSYFKPGLKETVQNFLKKKNYKINFREYLDYLKLYEKIF